jgi:predicted membrane protein
MSTLTLFIIVYFVFTIRLILLFCIKLFVQTIIHFEIRLFLRLFNNFSRKTWLYALITFMLNNVVILSLFIFQTVWICFVNSFISILYFFYNVDLLKMCNKFEMNTKLLEYVSDVNILIYDKNIDENCRDRKNV